MTLLDHLTAVLAELLREDDTRVLVGEDVRDGGTLGLSRLAMADPELATRVLAAPLTPTTALAHAAGLALGGARPIALMPSSQSLVDGLTGLCESVLATAGAFRLPLLVVAPVGAGFGLGGDVVLPVQSMLCHIDGLRVVVLGQVGEGEAVLRAAAEFWAGEEPAVLLLPRNLCLQPYDGEQAPKLLARPFATPTVRRSGSTATVFTWGACVDVVLTAAAHTDHDVAVVDLGTIAPLDRATLVDLARTTGKLVVVYDGLDHGPASQLAAVFADEAILHLDAPIVQVGGETPKTPLDERAVVPSPRAVLEALERVTNL